MLVTRSHHPCNPRCVYNRPLPRLVVFGLRGSFCTVSRSRVIVRFRALQRAFRKFPNSCSLPLCQPHHSGEPKADKSCQETSGFLGRKQYWHSAGSHDALGNLLYRILPERTMGASMKKKLRTAHISHAEGYYSIMRLPLIGLSAPARPINNFPGCIV